MEKKAYIAPEMEVMNVETVEMIAASLNMYGEYVDTETQQLSHGRRGKWGNLWAED